MTCVARSRCSSHFHSTNCPFFAKFDFFFPPPTCFSTTPIAAFSFASSSHIDMTSARKNEYAFNADRNGAISSDSSSDAFPTHNAVIEALNTLKFAHNVSKTRTLNIVGKLRKFFTRWYTSSKTFCSSTRDGSFSISSKHTHSTFSFAASTLNSQSFSIRNAFSSLLSSLVASCNEAKFVGISNSRMTKANDPQFLKVPFYNSALASSRRRRRRRRRERRRETKRQREFLRSFFLLFFFFPLPRKTIN